MDVPRIKALSAAVLRLEADRDRLTSERRLLAGEQDRTTKDLSEWESARDVLIQVLLSTQGRVKGFVEEVVSLALSTIYGSDHRFVLEFIQQRNQVEAVPWIVIGDQKFSPRDELGGGVLDVASLALRLAVWSVMEPRPSGVFLLDEPSKFLSEDLQAEFGRMLAELADLLGVQFVVVTHSPQVAEYADEAYYVRKDDGVSKVERVTT